MESNDVKVKGDIAFRWFGGGRGSSVWAMVV